MYKLDGMEKLKFTKKFADTEEKCEFIGQLLKQLTPK
jgi:hypothetical protein